MEEEILEQPTPVFLGRGASWATAHAVAKSQTCLSTQTIIDKVKTVGPTKLPRLHEEEGCPGCQGMVLASALQPSIPECLLPKASCIDGRRTTGTRTRAPASAGSKPPPS